MTSADKRRPSAFRWVPHPLLTVVLTLVWLMLLNEPSLGGLLFGVVLGLGVPLVTSRFWPQRPSVRGYVRPFAYALLVLWDIAVANVHVARLILFRRPDQLHTRWIVVPLDLTSPEAITLLAGTITMTPGTVSCDLAADGRSLLVHCLDAPDPEATVQQIKDRYERRLKEIFR